MRQYTPVITLALLSALALAVVSGGLLPSDNAVLAEHIPAQTNVAPVFSDSDGREILENTPAGVNIGVPVSATDAGEDTLTYSLDDDSSATFDIDSSTGQLITKAALNYEPGEPTRYSVTVTVNDGTEDDANNNASRTLTITVTDEAEEPAQPAPPVVTTGSAAASLEINWFPPENTGPAINDYDYRYKMTTETSWTEVENGTSTDTNATLGDREADTAYQVSVRAGSVEGDGPWSFAAVGTTNKEGNAAPVFASDTATRSVAENTPPRLRVGAAMIATDANSTTLNYSLAGAHANLFDIEGSTGQIKTKEPLNTEAVCREVDSNHETTCTYMVLVVVDDDGDGGSGVIAVTITVTDVSERPSQPAAPKVERVDDDTDTMNVDESTMMLKISWVAPETSGPTIDDYDIEYRKGTSGAFSDDNCGVTGGNNCQGISGTDTTITMLEADESYQVRVTANSNEQNSLPSSTRTGSTRPSNNAPVFSTPDLSRDVDENTPEGRNIGSPIRATESDRGDTLKYSLDETGAATFEIDEGTGQLKTKADLNHEATTSYAVTVTATDMKGATDTIEVTITINDVDEPPLAPSKPTVTVDTGSSTDTLDVTWTAPDNAGRPDITKYEVQYRVSGSWTSLDDVAAGTTSAEILNLDPFTNYTVQVRAVNDEGESPWVSSSELTNTVGNNLPQFTGSTDRSVEENTPRGQPVGLPVEASDADSDNLTHSLGGVHANLFSIDSSDGLIRVKESLNFEAECGDDSDHETRCTYNVDVKAVDGKGGSATAVVTIMVTDVTTEAPSAPSAPTVRAAVATEDEPNLDPTTMLEVSWDEPQNNGPSITAYAVRYKVSGVSDENFVSDNIQVEDNDATNTSVIITGLEDNTTYQVQVMATNLEGSSIWSRVGSGKTRFANTRPEFSRDSYDLTVKENTPSGRSIGRPVAATDDDGHTLTYSLEGVHKDEFTIERGSGHIRTRASLDYESRSGYSLTVRATDTEGGSAAVSVAIMVEDDTSEAPTRLGAPAVSAISGSTSSVRVSWEAPSNDGRPPIVDYDVQYRTGGGAFIPWSHDGTDTSTIITDLSAGTRYEVQVKAWNISEDSEWSPSGTGSPDADPANNAPTFSGGPRTFSVAENTAAGENIGAPVTATDSDRDSLAYSLEGTDAATFYIDPATGQIQTSGPLNHEEKASHSVTVKADDARGGMATVSVTINVTDVPGEAPEKPDTPMVVAASSTSLAVNWTAPDNPGPPITDYDYRYKEPTAGNWTEVANTAITQTNAIVSPLRPDTSYEVQVRAKNAEANGEWSDSGTGSTNAGGANNPPVFTEGASTTRTVIPNAQAGEHVGGPVTATDADQGDTVTYTLQGADAASFAIESQTGQITARVALSSAQVGDTYSVTVVASDGTAEATIAVTITVTAVSTVLPSVPDAPTVTPNSASATSLDVSWVAPANQGPPITDYDYQYRIAQGSGGIVIVQQWTTVDDTTITDTSETIENLTTGTEYEVQVRATNAGGTTDWSASGAGTPVNPGANNPPTFSSATTTRAVAENTSAGTYIADPVSATDADPNDTLTYSLSGTDASSFNIDDETGQLMTRVPLDYEVKRSYSVTVTASDGTDSDEIQVTVSVTDMNPRCTTQVVGNDDLTNDCEALLESRPVLEGTNGSRLNWSERRPMAQWEGITLRGTPRRVTRLDLMDVGLHGTIPASLSRLSELTHLNLRSNPDLTGEVPGELGNLSKLRLLNLHSNSHTGGVPDLRNATLLEELYLANNADYNSDGSKIHGTGLTGRIPTWLNGMTNMEELWLWGNSLTGSVPNLSGMTSLDKLKLANNNLTGGIPQASTLPPNMTWLIIDRNPFRGTIPNLSSLSRLRLLWLHSSRLTGTVPAGSNFPASLDDLNLRDNMLTGTIPDLSNLDNLTRLRLHNNSLSGEVPATLGGLDSLKQLWLHNEDATKTTNGNNRFTSIAAGVGELGDTLIVIALSGNPWDANACVPAELANVASNDYAAAGIAVCSAN